LSRTSTNTLLLATLGLCQTLSSGSTWWTPLSSVCCILLRYRCSSIYSPGMVCMFIVMTSQKMLAWHNRTSGVMKERSKHIYENISPRIRSSFRLEEAYLSTSKRRHAAAPDPCQYISWAWTNKTLSNSAIVYVYEIAHHSVFEFKEHLVRSLWSNSLLRTREC
jgi:hypothetical protein